MQGLDKLGAEIANDELADACEWYEQYLVPPMTDTECSP